MTIKKKLLICLLSWCIVYGECRSPVVCSSHVSQNVTLDNMVIVLPVCSLAKWTVTKFWGDASVGRFVRVSVWSTSDIWQHVCYVGGHWLYPSHHLTSNKTNHVTTEHQSHKTCFLVGCCIYICYYGLSYTAETWITAVLLPHFRSTDACLFSVKLHMCSHLS